MFLQQGQEVGVPDRRDGGREGAGKAAFFFAEPALSAFSVRREEPPPKTRTVSRTDAPRARAPASAWLPDPEQRVLSGVVAPEKPAVQPPEPEAQYHQDAGSQRDFVWGGVLDGG